MQMCNIHACINIYITHVTQLNKVIDPTISRSLKEIFMFYHSMLAFNPFPLAVSSSLPLALTIPLHFFLQVIDISLKA
jgi:hypothetical protein